jgi:hypothetical protein
MNLCGAGMKAVVFSASTDLLSEKQAVNCLIGMMREHFFASG